jgi:hypothetical protein
MSNIICHGKNKIENFQGGFFVMELHSFERLTMHIILKVIVVKMMTMNIVNFIWFVGKFI